MSKNIRGHKGANFIQLTKTHDIICSRLFPYYLQNLSNSFPTAYHGVMV